MDNKLRVTTFAENGKGKEIESRLVRPTAKNLKVWLVPLLQWAANNNVGVQIEVEAS